MSTLKIVTIEPVSDDTTGLPVQPKKTRKKKVTSLTRGQAIAKLLEIN